jgi:hypothetical protein
MRATFARDNTRRAATDGPGTVADLRVSAHRSVRAALATAGLFGRALPEAHQTVLTRAITVAVVTLPAKLLPGPWLLAGVSRTSVTPGTHLTIVMRQRVAARLAGRDKNGVQPVSVSRQQTIDRRLTPTGASGSNAKNTFGLVEGGTSRITEANSITSAEFQRR